MGLLPEKVYRIAMILEGLLLFAVAIWNLKGVYENYQKGCAFQDGRHKTVSNVVMCVIIFFQFLIPTIYKIFMVVFVLGLQLVFFVRLDHHNKANHTGEQFLFLDHEIKRVKRQMALALVLILIAGFLLYREWNYWYGSNWLYAAAGFGLNN